MKQIKFKPRKTQSLWLSSQSPPSQSINHCAWLSLTLMKNRLYICINCTNGYHLSVYYIHINKIKPRSLLILIDAVLSLLKLLTFTVSLIRLGNKFHSFIPFFSVVFVLTVGNVKFPTTTCLVMSGYVSMIFCSKRKIPEQDTRWRNDNNISGENDQRV